MTEFGYDLISTYMVERLNLPCIELIAPYKWKGVKKNKRVLLSFTVGSYKDKVWCDVVLMYNLSYLNEKIIVWYANSGASYYIENNKYSQDE
uniref:Putative ovule protein n=1 Tax=Solanum chacoense TaxID=4108 RepID=A0A0V0GVL0_SOLCH